MGQRGGVEVLRYAALPSMPVNDRYPPIMRRRPPPSEPGLGDVLETLGRGSSALPPAYATYFTDASLLRGKLGGPAVVV